MKKLVWLPVLALLLSACSVTEPEETEGNKSGYQITQSLEIFSFQPIHIEIREDDIIDGVGTGTLHVAICDGGFGKTEIAVTESGGRYDGNTAVWEVTCKVKPVGKQ